MPGMGVVNVGWLNQNELRAYPLSDSATRQDDTATYTLPNNFLADMVISVNGALNYNPANFYLSKMSVFGTGVTIELSYWTGTQASLIGKISIQASTFEQYRTYQLEGEDDFEGVTGKVVIGSLDTVLLQPGVFSFDLVDGRIEPTVVVPDIRGITGVRILDGEDLGDLYQGDIAFEAGSNFRITKSDFGGVTVLTLNAISGEGTIAECVCEGEEAESAPIRTINGVSPDTLGNINLLGDDCLVPEPKADENAIEISDVCSKPCCGCPELETLVEDQKRMRDQVQTLENLASRLEGVVAVMQTLMTTLGQCTG
jgi:hypothetical protein